MTIPAILIVEDEQIIAKGIEKRLKGLGYTVAGLATTGEEAIQKAAEFCPDMILMDIHLGRGMNGIEAASLIRSRLDRPVVYLTAHSDDATVMQAKLTEPFGYVLKPFEDKELQIAVEIGLYKHKIEQRLRENQQWLSATLASIGDGVIATDEHGRVRLMNTLAERLTGWRQAEALGRDVQEVFQTVAEGTLTAAANPVLDALAKRPRAAVGPNLVLISKAGIKLPIDDSVAPIRDVNGKMSGAVLVFRDITERRRLEAQLSQAQTIDAIGRLAGGIAHDFNNILTIILGSSELLLAGGQCETERNALAQEIFEAGNRAAALTKQIVAFGRKQLLVPCALNLNSMVRDMTSMVQELIGEDNELVMDVAPDLGQVQADPRQIVQVLLNLATNARDAMPNGGRLTIATSNAKLDHEMLRQNPDISPGWYATISVSDTGRGMSEEALAHAFEPFYTTKRAGQGSGLGLSTVYGIVKQSGGHIEVSSKAGEGTIFRIYLPLSKPPEIIPNARMTLRVANGIETILLVEDEERIRRMTKTMLQQGGYMVLEASNGLEAVSIAEQHREHIHLLMTDLVMPHLSGRELAERLIAVRPEIRVLFMSGYTEDSVVHQGVEWATIDFLQKPFRLAAMTQKVREILDRTA